MYGYGVTMMAVFQGRGWVEASVQLQSGHEAVRARDALHGKNIYDGCCKLSIECTSVPNPRHDSYLPEAPVMTMGATATASSSIAAPTSSTLVVGADMQLSAFTREAAPLESTTAVVLDGIHQHDAQPLCSEDCTGVLTQVGGMSLFLELGFDSADENSVWNEESPEDVVTHFGGISLFLEPGLKSSNEMFVERPSKDMASHMELSDEVLTHIGGLSLFLEFDLDLIVASADRVLHGDLPWKCLALCPWSNAWKDIRFLLANMPQNAFRSGHNGMPSSYLVMDKWLPWSRSGFSPGLGDCLRYLFPLVCTQPFGNFVPDVTIQPAVVLNTYNGMLTALRNLFVAKEDTREVCMLVMHWHSTVLTVQCFSLLLQLHLHVLNCGSRGRQKTRSPTS
jgi:hypothetical protein